MVLSATVLAWPSVTYRPTAYSIDNILITLLIPALQLDMNYTIKSACHLQNVNAYFHTKFARFLSLSLAGIFGIAISQV